MQAAPHPMQAAPHPMQAAPPPRVTMARVEAPSTMAASRTNTKTTSLPRNPLLLLAKVRTSMVRSRQRAFLRTITLTLPSDSNKLSRLSKTASLEPMDHPPPLITAKSVLMASLPPPLMDPSITNPLQLMELPHSTSLLQLMVPLITSLHLLTTHLHTIPMEPLRFRPRLLNSQLVDLVHTHPAASIQAAPVSMETTLTSLKHKLPSNQDSTEVHPQYMVLNHTPTSSPPPHLMEQQLPSTNPSLTRVFMAKPHSLNLSSPHSSNLSRTHSRLRPSSQ